MMKVLPSMSDPTPSSSLLANISRELSDLVQRTMRSVISLNGILRNLSEVAASGFVFDDAGHILTNHHVVEDCANAMRGHLPNEEYQPVQLVGVDPMTDLAVLALAHPTSVHLQLRERSPQLGELCLALGSPLGVYTESVALGVVSGLGRSVSGDDSRRPLEHAIQTDAAINHGNSGGPLIDLEGFVIGVNQSGIMDAQGINFAVPAETATYVAKEILQFGSVRRAALGVAVSEQSKVIDGTSGRRLVVSGVDVGPTGLQVGDVLLKVAGTPINDRGDLFRVLSRDKIGKKVCIEVFRGSARQEVDLVPKELG